MRTEFALSPGTHAAMRLLAITARVRAVCLPIYRNLWKTTVFHCKIRHTFEIYRNLKHLVSN